MTSSSRFALVVLLLGGLAAGACATTVVTPRIAGRLVDERTGEPIAGATILMYRFSHGTVRYPSALPFGEYWTTTDSAGRFEFPEHRDEPYTGGRVQPVPSLWVYHPDYGHPTGVVLPRDPLDWGDAVLQIAPESLSMDEIRERKAGRWHGPETVCGGMGGDEYQRCCRVVYKDDYCLTR